VVEFGCAFFANRRLITVFSAARYHEGLCNFATVVVYLKYLKKASAKVLIIYGYKWITIWNDHFYNLSQANMSSNERKSSYQRQMLKMI
uniref:Uncharacterized protein n=1 Tax=Wuchereria bancrofti TaxID=6293 RepID=A0A1I8EWH3_WUCBA